MPDGKSLGIIEDWSLRVVDPADSKELRWFGGHTAPISSVGFAPGGKLLATVAADQMEREPGGGLFADSGESGELLDQAANWI